MAQINPRPGACVCIARWNGDIVYDKPHAYNPLTQGDSPAWRELVRQHERRKPDAEGKAAHGKRQDRRTVESAG